MICPRCSTPMKLAMNGAYQCPECWDKAEPVRPDPAAPVEGTALALQRLQRRVGRLEVAVADLRRRTQTSAEQRLQRLYDWLEAAGLLPRGEDTNPFLGSVSENEEPRRGEPGETR